MCHLCGRGFRSVTAHLSSHRWTKAEYCETFGLERRQSLEGADTRKLRAAAFSARLVFEPALRTGSARGHELARSGQLTREAADAARGRPFPEQRRQRSRTAFSVAARTQLAQANRDRAHERLASVADTVARDRGYADIGQLVQDMIRAGHSLTGISLACGLHKDWMSRHLARLDPAAAAAAVAGEERLDARWMPALHVMGFKDVAGYLRQRHLVQHMSVNAIAREAGLSFPAVKSALSRHGLDMAPHATKRHSAQSRAAEVAARLGVRSVVEFIAERRAEGWTWQQLSSASGQSQAWLRRQAAGHKQPTVGSAASSERVGSDVAADGDPAGLGECLQVGGATETRAGA
jgi:AraC-like DNA-binding protein